MTRKNVLAQDGNSSPSINEEWLDPERLARVEVTSEDPVRPVEGALLPDRGNGWRASQAGEQRLRLLFDEPQMIRRVYLVFDEHERARTQELVLF